ncbi:MAG TPA: cytochrome c [Kofleriaceae bacterium]|nr:cytochrome c [Kofleriaceae bacterium]
MASKHSTWHVVTVKLRYALGLVATVALSGCEQKLAGGSADGAKVFQSICAACHGPKGKPSAQAVATTGVKDLTSQELRHRITPALVENQVRKGSQNKLMPAFEGALTDEQIKAVAAYVASPEFLDQ